MEKEEVKISVRELVEFILRSGDIDNRRGGWADKESLAKGTRIHKKVQRQMGAAYQPRCRSTAASAMKIWICSWKAGRME